jgi:hypothetical protein
VNTYQWEWTTIAALIAPRPMLFANSDNDTIFPMAGNRRIIARLRQVYKMYDKPDLVDDYVSKGGHDYRPDLRVAIFQWINKRLKNDTGPVKDAQFKPLPGKELRVFVEDKDLPKDALNGKIDETFVKRAEIKLPEAGKFAEWKKEMVKELRQNSFRSFAGRTPGYRFTKGLADLEGANSVTTEVGLEIAVYYLVGTKPEPKEGANTLLKVVLNPGEKADVVSEWGKPYTHEYAGHIVAPRGVGPGAWTRKSPPNYVERAHALLGRTVDEGRVWDIVSYFNSPVPELRYKVIGRGQAGILAAYAGLFNPRIKEVVIVDPPTSHRNGPIFLNVLRVLDIPEALGMLAPDVKLTLIGAKDKAFDRTAQLYKLAGAEDKFERK